VNIAVLSEGRVLDGFESEHGLSFLIEVDQKMILFDTGASDLFRQNSAKLGIDLEKVDRIVLSHGNWDHGNGLEHMAGKRLICYPGCFDKRFRSCRQYKEGAGYYLWLRPLGHM